MKLWHNFMNSQCHTPSESAHRWSCPLSAILILCCLFNIHFHITGYNRPIYCTDATGGRRRHSTQHFEYKNIIMGLNRCRMQIDVVLTPKFIHSACTMHRTLISFQFNRCIFFNLYILCQHLDCVIRVEDYFRHGFQSNMLSKINVSTNSLSK